ncbi:MAG: type I polyketide synthase [Planctomycetota bacterium]
MSVIPNGSLVASGAERVEASDIAIVGMALHVPGARTLGAFWSNLCAGVESSTAFTNEELLARGVPPSRLRNPAYVKRSPVLEGVDLFDAPFFGFSPREAAILDPQHRHFLECAWECIEDAGHPPTTFAGPIGVFAGCGMSSYFTFNLLSNPALVESVGMFLLRHTGNDKDFLTTRASYCFDLKGPSINVQTACSTSLVAVHLACQSLIGGECDMALAGGVTIELPHGTGYLFKEGEILSPDGHCRVFDHRSQGTVFSSGVGVVALRRLSDARRDGDRIYAIIKGSAVNSDGAGKVGYLAPSVDGQAAAIAEALALAGVDPETIEYVEAHGTGTPIGDPIEVAALARALRRSPSRPNACGLGSLKANIGHTDTAAGVVGLIKTALALHHEEIPPTPNFEAPSLAIPFAETPFYVVDRLRPWPRGTQPRRAGVNSLGVGGTNAHVVLEEAARAAPSVPSKSAWQLLALSARSSAALDATARELAVHLRENPALDLADVAFTLATARRAFEHRRVLACRDRSDALALLESGDPKRVFTHRAASSAAPVVFLLPGGGVQHVGMGRGLYESEPTFRATIDRGIDELLRRTGCDLRQSWLAVRDLESAARDLERPSLQLPAIFLLEYALAELWASRGVKPEALIGHSLGENTAACLAGVLSFEDTLGLVALRGELFERLPAGGMVSVALAADELARHLGPDIDLAALNAPSVSVISGPAGPLDDLTRRLRESGAELRRLPIATAAHSRMVEPILPAFLAHLATLRFSPPRIPFVSNVTGTWITAEQAVSPQYWVGHLRSTVRFADGVRTLLEGPERVFLEVGPGKALLSFVRQQPDAASRNTGTRSVVASLRHAEEDTSDAAHLLTSFGRLWACGVPVDLGVPWRDESRTRVSLPSYPFQRQRHWIEPGKRVEVEAEREPTWPRRVEIVTEGMHRPVWKERDVERDPQGNTGRKHVWLVLLDSCGVGEALVQRLRARGDTVVTVCESDDNRVLGPNAYALAPERGREGYDDLVRDLVANGTMPDRIVHMWLLTADEGFRPGSNFFHRNQERGFYSLFFLAQALGEEEGKGPLHITIVGNGMHALDDETLAHPAKATVFGPCRVIPREFEGFTCSTFDIPLPIAQAPSKWSVLTHKNGRAEHAKSLADLVATEVLAPPRNSDALSRDGRRHERVFQHVELSPANNNGHAPIRQRGVYLITGGLGGIGLELGLQLARHARARLVLVGRSPMPERHAWDAWSARHAQDDATSARIRAIRGIEAAGGEVEIACADVTDIEAMRAVIRDARRRFGSLNGVVHAAGVLRDAPILTKSQEEVEAVFAPKVHGTLVLDALLADAELDFLLLFSSTSAVIAPPGQVDYVAANAFLDAYARAARGTRRTRTVSVNWGIWNAGGMAAHALSVADGAQRTPDRVPTVGHPLFDSRAMDPDAPLVLEACYAPQTHWILGEHRTKAGHAVVPGTAYLELARAALAEVGEGAVFELRDVLLLSPLHVPDNGARTVRVELRRDPQGYAFTVRSRPANAARDARFETHAQANVRLDVTSLPALVPLREIEQRCTAVRSAQGRAALPSPQEEAVRFGPRWHTLREVRMGDGEVLATLELAEEFAVDLTSYRLHPALVDIASAIGLGLSCAPTDSGLWVPVSYKRVRVHGSLTRRIRSWVRARATNRAEAGLALFDVSIVDDAGRTVVEMEEFAMRCVNAVASLAGANVCTQASACEASQPPAQSVTAASPALAALQYNFEHGIRPEEGLEAMLRILGASDAAQVVATSLELDALRVQIDELITRSRPTAADARAPDVETDGSDDGASDGIERTLTGFWRELLGVHSVGARDNFFDLGGHSLIAVRLFARIKKTFRVEFPISLLFEAPTIETCAQAIRLALAAEKPAHSNAAPVREARFTHLVAMHPGQGGEKTPFFLVAGMFGNVLNLRHLAHLIGNERRFFGLQALGLYGAHKPHETFEDTAADYLAELRRVQPHGPYLLGGFSGGGITAFEMALQLTSAGEQVAFLAMLDTALPSSPRLSAIDRARVNWDRIRQRGPAYVTEWARDKLRWEIAQLRKHYRSRAELMPSEFRSEEIGNAFRRALARYELRHYTGEITLFRPKIEVAHVLGIGRELNVRREFVHHENGWSPHCDRVRVNEVPGDHDSMVLEPNVRVLAAKLRKCIHAAESSIVHTRGSAPRSFDAPRGLHALDVSARLTGAPR